VGGDDDDLKKEGVAGVFGRDFFSQAPRRPIGVVGVIGLERRGSNA
jgi:hypothetical protein